VLKNPFTLDTAPKKIIKPVVAEPVAEGYDAKAYNKAMDIVKEGRNPTPQELTDLLRLMDFDSPLGEMKPEAHAIWKEIRSKGVISTIGGYIALLNVYSPDCFDV
jgi:hypothetical protein